MITAELLPSKNLFVYKCKYTRVFWRFVKKIAVPKVSGSNPDGCTTSFNNHKSSLHTVYAALSGLAISLFSTKIYSAAALSFSVFSSFLTVFAEFYCRVTAELADLFSYVYPNTYEHDP